MSIDRRRFLKVSGITVAGLAAGSPSRLLGQEDIAPAPLSQETGPVEPVTAERWAMVIDLRRCQEAKDCNKCVEACHSVHNVPDFDNKKDEIKWLWKTSFEGAFHDTEHEFLVHEVSHGPVLVTCNHCAKPPCVRVCPTQATWKRESDGIVMMDMHRCIGCRYCIVACPYGSRSFNWRDPRPHIEEVNPEFPTRMRGVVEKCNFCAERLARGIRTPACVEACDQGALFFGDLEDPKSEVRRLLHERFSIRRRPELGTGPEVYYLV